MASPPEPRRISGITAVLALVALLMLLHWTAVVLVVHPWFIPTEAIGVDLSLPAPPYRPDFARAQAYRPWVYTWLPEGTEAHDHVPWFGLVCAVTGVLLALGAAIAHLLGTRRPWPSWALLVLVSTAPFVLPRTWTGVQRSEVWTCAALPCDLVEPGLPVRARDLGLLELDWRNGEPRVVIDLESRAGYLGPPYPWCPRPFGSLEVGGHTLVAEPIGAPRGHCATAFRWTGRGAPPDEAFHPVVEVPVAEGGVVYDLGILPGTASLGLPDTVVASVPHPLPRQDDQRAHWLGRFALADGAGRKTWHGCGVYLFVEHGQYHFAAADSGPLGDEACKPGPIAVPVRYEGGADLVSVRLWLGERTVNVVERIEVE